MPNSVSPPAESVNYVFASIPCAVYALSTERPYRPRVGYEECVAAFRADAVGGGLDPEVVRCWCETVSVPS